MPIILSVDAKYSRNPYDLGSTVQIRIDLTADHMTLEIALKWNYEVLIRNLGSI